MNQYRQLLESLRASKLKIHGIEVYRGGGVSLREMTGHDVRYPAYSATKSVTSLAIGIAEAEGKIDISRPLADYLDTAYLSAMPEDKREAFGRLPVERFLTMTVSGYSFRPEGEDWLSNVLGADVDYSAQPQFHYTNVQAYLAGIACENAVGIPLDQYLTQRLFEPMGIEAPEFQKDAQGRFYGASGMYLTVHELAQLGVLCLNEGSYEGRQLVPAQWIRRASGSHADAGDKGGYGYYFWQNGNTYSISGKWGQRSIVCPEKGTVVTYMADVRSEPEKLQRIAEEFIANI